MAIRIQSDAELTPEEQAEAKTLAKQYYASDGAMAQTPTPAPSSQQPEPQKPEPAHVPKGRPSELRPGYSALESGIMNVASPFQSAARGFIGGATDRELLEGAMKSNKTLWKALTPRSTSRYEEREVPTLIGERKKFVSPYPGIETLGHEAGAITALEAGILKNIGKLALTKLKPATQALLKMGGWGGLYGGAGAVGERANQEAEDTSVLPETTSPGLQELGQEAGTFTKGAIPGALISMALMKGLQGAGKIPGIISKGFRKSVPKSVEEEIAAAAGLKKPLPLSAGEATGSKRLLAYENWLRRHPATMEAMEKMDRASLEAELENIKMMRDQFPEMSDELTKKGEQIQAALSRTKTTRGAYEDRLYRQPSREIPTGQDSVEMKQSTDLADMMREGLRRRGQTGTMGDLATELQPFQKVEVDIPIEPKLKAALDSMKDRWPENVIRKTLLADGFPPAEIDAAIKGGKILKNKSLTWEDTQQINNDLSSRITAFEKAGKTSEAAQLIQVKEALDKDRAAFAKRVGGRVKEAYDFAKRFTHEDKLIWQDPKIEQILKANPGAVIEIAAQGGATTRNFMKQARMALHPSLVEDMKGAYLQKLLFPDAPLGTAEADMARYFNHAKFRKSFQSESPESIKAMLGDDGFEGLRQMFLAFEASPGAKYASKFPRGEGGYIQAAAGAAPAQAAYAAAKGKPVEGMGVLARMVFAPSMLGRWYTNPRVQKYLKTGKVDEGWILQSLKEAAKKGTAFTGGEIGEDRGRMSQREMQKRKEERAKVEWKE